jgi:hypothetical protein
MKRNIQDVGVLYRDVRFVGEQVQGQATIQ